MSDSTTVTSTLSTDTAPKRGKSIQRSQIYTILIQILYI